MFVGEGTTALRVRDHDLAEGLGGLVVAVGLDRLGEREDAVDHRLDRVCLDRAVHRFEVRACSNGDRAHVGAGHPQQFRVERR